MRGNLWFSLISSAGAPQNPGALRIGNGSKKCYFFFAAFFLAAGFFAAFFLAAMILYLLS